MLNDTALHSHLKTQVPDNDWYKRRIIVLLCLVVPVFMLLLLRLFYLQIVEGGNFRKLSEHNCIRLQAIDPPRGLIFDRNGRLLVDNRPSYDLSIVVRDAKPLNATLQRLSRYTRMPLDALWAEIEKYRNQPSYKPVPLLQDIGRDMLAVLEVNRYELPGIVIDVRLRRLYVNDQSAAHILGYVGEISSDELKSPRYANYKRSDIVGKAGVEKTFENVLRGERGGRQVEVNAAGQLVKILKTVDAVPGNNLFLSFDLDLQQKAEKLIDNVHGAVVAMDPVTGSVLAMASSPSYDPNMFINGFSQEQWQKLISDPFHPLENKAIQAEYPPASTYKIITAMAGLQEGVINDGTTLFCPGFYKFGGRDYRCWKKSGHGSINVTKALAESCDVFFYQVGLRLGVDRLAFYAKASGLGSLTGIQLDHESAGLVPTSDWKKRRFKVSWQSGETLSVAIGQGYNLVTPLQLCAMIATVANGGTRFVPQIVSKIENASGDVIKKTAPEVAGHLPVSPDNLDIVKKGLWDVVNERYGTGRIGAIPGVEVSGKTGTAQVFSRKTNDTENEKQRAERLRSHAWFVSYAPSDNPKIAVAVLVEHGVHGASAAAPIAREVIRAYLSESTSQPSGEAHQ